MQQVLSNSWHKIIRFDQGDDVIAGILDFTKENKIESGWVYMIGSSKEVELGFYDLKKKEYLKKVFSEPLEILGVEGNLAIMKDSSFGKVQGSPILHIHGSFGRSDYSTLGGHIHKLIANATVEVFIHKINKILERKQDLITGLKLL